MHNKARQIFNLAERTRLLQNALDPTFF